MLRRGLTVLLWVVGAMLVGKGVYMDAKASLAQVLIANAWQQRTDSRPPPKPWWWADTRPIARMVVPSVDASVYVMQDSSGESLAFGPGHIAGSDEVSTEGHVMLAGHRDSHFAFLKEVQIGDSILTENERGETAQYRVMDLAVVDTRSEEFIKLDATLLTLITCYPFDSLVPSGPLRYVVTAERVVTSS